MRMKVKRFLTSVNSSNCYIAWCPETREGAIIDPAEFTDEMRETIERERIALKDAYITHGHYDHDGAVGEVADEFGLTVVAAGNYPKVKKVTGGEKLNLGGIDLRVAAVPGHTDDSVAFVTEGAAFVGDALFAAALGGTANRARFEQEVAAVLKEILSLPGETVLYTGHGPATTVAVERAYNPFFIRI